MKPNRQTETKRTQCTRCGECCAAAAPSLQKADLPLFFDHVIDGTQLYTVRQGELVWDNVNDELDFTKNELIKFRDHESGDGCILYDGHEKACSIYADRPSQCRAFTCWNDEKFKDVFSGPKASREDIIKDPSLLQLISAHETKCSYRAISRHVKQIPELGEVAVQAILKILQYDQDIRQLTHEKLNIDPQELDFLFGRSLMETIHMFGLTVKQAADGSFLLTTEGEGC
jgi:Fe-S-cluster containining protein